MVAIHEGCTDLLLNTWIGASLLTFDHVMMKCLIWIDLKIFFFVFQLHLDRFCVIIYSALYTRVNLQILCKLQYAMFLFFFCHFHREHCFFSLLVILFIFFGIFCSRRRRLSWNKYKFKYIIGYWLEL